MKILYGDVGEPSGYIVKTSPKDTYCVSFLQYPTAVAHHLYKLGQVHGHAKVSYTLMSMGLPESLLKIMEGYLRYGRAFKVEGCDF